MSGISNQADQNLRHAIVKNAVAVDVSATDDTLSSPSVLYIGGTGDVTVDTAGGQAVTYKDFFGGQFLPVLVTKVYKVGTTATNMLAHW